MESYLTDVHSGKPSLGSYLEQGFPLGYDNGILTIGFNRGASVFINLIERKESKDFILKYCEESFAGCIGCEDYYLFNRKDSNSPALNEYVSNAHDKRQEEVEDAFTEPIVKRCD